MSSTHFYICKMCSWFFYEATNAIEWMLICCHRLKAIPKRYSRKPRRVKPYQVPVHGFLPMFLALTYASNSLRFWEHLQGPYFIKFLIQTFVRIWISESPWPSLLSWLCRSTQFLRFLFNWTSDQWDPPSLLQFWIGAPWPCKKSQYWLCCSNFSN